MVMMSMMSSTSMTSMSGVVLISTITSPSGGVPLLSAISICPRTGGPFGLGDERDLADAGPLAIDDDAADEFVAHFLVGADMHFGLRIVAGACFELGEQRRIVG